MLINIGIFDTIVLISALIISAYISIRVRNILGILIGALTLWIMMLIEGYFLSLIDNNRSPLSDHIWFLFGLPSCIIYCAITYYISKMIILLYKRYFKRLR